MKARMTLTRQDSWKNIVDKYPVSDLSGFTDASWGDDVAPSYVGLDGRCVIVLMDDASQRDMYGDYQLNRTYREQQLSRRLYTDMTFVIVYHPTEDVYETDEAMTIDVYTWLDVRRMVALLKWRAADSLKYPKTFYRSIGKGLWNPDR